MPEIGRPAKRYAVCDPVFTDNSLDQRKGYKCPMCTYLLGNAVQTSCGHRLCQDCAEDIFRKNSRPVCPRGDCGEILKSEEFFPDKFVRKQISKFPTRCRNYDNKCLWTGTFIELLKHLETYIYEQEECPHCYEMFRRSKFADHKRNCPKALVICPYCKITKKITEVEYAEHFRKDHRKTLMALSQKSKRKEYKDSITDVNVEITYPRPFISTPGQSSEPSLPKEIEDHEPCATDGDPDGQRLGTDEETSKQQREAELLKRQITAKNSEICHLQDQIQKMRTSVLVTADRDFRLSLMENSNYDGTMVWKIPQFSQRMEDARTGKYTSIFSLPFYSDRYGYKMCLCLYILGDGIGKGSHMSLFFVLMKGEFDNILQWPFTHKVTFKLINQCGGRDVVDIFHLSSNFQKPKTDMNIASGCPRFVSLNELMQNGFIVEDTIFIKVKVDLTTMKHP